MQGIKKLVYHDPYDLVEKGVTDIVSWSVDRDAYQLLVDKVKEKIYIPVYMTLLLSCGEIDFELE